MYTEGAFWTIGGWADTAQYGYVDEICRFSLENNEWSLAGKLQATGFYFSTNLATLYFTAFSYRELETQVEQFLLTTISLLSAGWPKKSRL